MNTYQIVEVLQDGTIHHIDGGYNLREAKRKVAEINRINPELRLKVTPE